MSGFKQFTTACKTGAVALSVLLAVSAQSALAAGGNVINSIDFLTSRNSTDIIINAPKTVQYKTMMIANNKVIIDFHGVDAQRSIKTNFKGSGSISHVTLQPLSETKLRLTLRGMNLGRPSIDFNTVGTGTRATTSSTKKVSKQSALSLPQRNVAEEIDTDALIEEANAALNEFADENTSDANFDPSALENTDEMIHEASETDTTMSDEALSDVNNDETLDNSLADESLASLMGTDGGDATMMDDLENGNVPLPSNAIQQAEAPADGNIFSTIQSWPLADISKYGLLGCLLLGAGIFIKNKMDKLRLKKSSYDELMHEQEQGNTVSFRDMANAYREQSGSGPSQTTRMPARGKQSPIGLGGFTKQAPNEMSQEPLATSQQSESLMERMRRINQQGGVLGNNTQKQEPFKTSPPSRQVVNQYKKQNAPGSMSGRGNKGMKRRPKMNDDLLRQELARKNEIQQSLQSKKQAGTQPAKRQPPSAGAKPRQAINQRRKPAPEQIQADSLGNKSPLPDNPAVLNFLKEVSHLVEQDGKPGIAQSIKKNMRPRSV